MEVIIGTAIKIRKSIIESLPSNAEITRIEFEGPKIVIYSRKPEVFLEDDERLIKEIVGKIKKRIVIRGDPDSRLSEKEAEKIIRDTVPEEANIHGIYFNDISGEVEIEAEKPGYVIGKDGVTLKKILAKTLWYPRVMRKPPMTSRTVYEIRELYRSRTSERIKFLREIGQKIYRTQLFKSDYIRIIGLGSFQEVGRSAILIQTPESNILLDIGIKPSSNTDELPYLEVPEFDIEKLDAVIITHAHLDHCGALPYLYKYGYRGPVYMTEPTLHMMKLLQEDYLKISERDKRSVPYAQRDISEAVLHSYTLNYGEVTDISPDTKLTLYPSGHILGSAIIHLHIGEGLLNIVYTSDFKFARTALLDPANYKFPRVEVLIMESTYSGPNDVLPDRIETEMRFVEVISRTFRRGGVALIPVLAVGRAQEILYVLKKAMNRKLIPEVPIFIEGMIDEVAAIHTTFPEYLTNSVKELIYRDENPFTAPNVIILKGNNREEVINTRPCVILATSGMLTGGPVMEYLRLLAGDEKSSLIFVSYQVEGTLGNRILQGLRKLTFTSEDGKIEIRELKMEVHRIEGFSGHSDRRQLMGYLKHITPRPRKVILNHGEASKIREFRKLVEKAFGYEVYVPQNLETLRVL
ncbi:MAG TPA: beta-CASP ribonuclease aCPSF1 [Thermofilum sp.]|nr:beta-CASP ribonuclease aCPSF1 [Thermofilum sp.]